MSRDTRKCYDREGKETSDFPCMPESVDSFCCGVGWRCMSNGLCGRDSYQALGSCTKKNWNTKQCASFCLYSDFPANQVNSQQCYNLPYEWCCGTSDDSCCGQDVDPSYTYFNLPSSTIAGTIDGSTFLPRSGWEWPDNWEFEMTVINAQVFSSSDSSTSTTTDLDSDPSPTLTSSLPESRTGQSSTGGVTATAISEDLGTGSEEGKNINALALGLGLGLGIAFLLALLVGCYFIRRYKRLSSSNSSSPRAKFSNFLPWKKTDPNFEDDREKYKHPEPGIDSIIAGAVELPTQGRTELAPGDHQQYLGSGNMAPVELYAGVQELDSSSVTMGREKPQSKQFILLESEKG